MCGRWCVWSVRERCFIKNDMAGDDDTPRGEIVASVALMLERIPEKNTMSGARTKLVIGRGVEVGEAKTTKKREGDHK